MQYISYIPGNHSTRCLNREATSSCCLPFDSDEVDKRKPCWIDSSPSHARSEVLDCDKEVLRQTMLKHESEFNYQVRELHRVYRRQKELMAEIKCQDLWGYNRQVKVPDSNSFPSQTSSDFYRISQIPMSNSCKMLHRETKRSGRQLLDLQLPANKVVDIEEEEAMERGKFSEVLELSTSPLNNLPKKDNKISISNFMLSSSGCVSYPGSQVQTDARPFVDLNSAMKLEKEEALSSFSYPKAVPSSGQMLCKNLLENASSRSQYQPSFQGFQRTDECSSSIQHMEQREHWLPCVDQAGPIGNKVNNMPQGFCQDKFHLSKTSGMDPGFQPPEIHMRSYRGAGVAGISTSFSTSSSNSLGHSASHDWTSLHQLVPRADMVNSKLPSEVSCLKPSHERVPTTLQAFPSFKSLIPLGQRSKLSAGSSAEFAEVSNITSDFLCIGGKSFYGNISQQGPKPASGYQALTGLDLNCSKDITRSSQHARCTQNFSSLNSLGVSALGMNLPTLPPQDLWGTDADTTFRDSAGKLFWLRGKDELNNKRADILEDPNLRGESGFSSQGFSAFTCSIKSWKNEKSNTLERNKIFGFPINISSTSSYESQLNSCADVNNAQSNKSSIIDINVACTDTPEESPQLTNASSPIPKLKSSEDVEAKNSKQVGVIDLNVPFIATAESTDQLMLTSSPGSHEFLSRDEDIEKGTKDQVTDTIVAFFGTPSKTYQQEKSSPGLLNPSGDEDTENNDKLVAQGVNVDIIATPDNQRTKTEVIDGDEACFATSESSYQLDGHNAETELEKKLKTPVKSIELHLEAPISPENKEHSPPRGESEESRDDLQLSDWEDEDNTAGELVKIAAGALVSISASEVQTSLETTTSCKQSEGSHSDSLQWFASVVSSSVYDYREEFGAISSDKVAVTKRTLSSPGIDFFEVMTLSLTELRTEKHFSGNNENMEVEGAASFSQTRSRKGRMRMGRQKGDFQNEILPCLASLSRHEVTEDLQIIGGLIKSTGTSSLSAGLTKSASTNAMRKGRRRSPRIFALDAGEGTISSPMKKQADNIGLCMEKMSLLSWGKITRRRRGARCTATNSPLISSQV